MVTKTLWLLRGVSGAGKSTLAEQLMNNLPDAVDFSADQYHINQEGIYDWKPENIQASHNWCQQCIEHAMIVGKWNVIVHNTLTTEKEMAPYLEFAKRWDYKVVSLVVENRHGNDSIHDVPQVQRQKQEQRLRGSIKLI